jgi:hypothetical protein
VPLTASLAVAAVFDAQLSDKDVDARWADSAARAAEEGSSVAAMHPVARGQRQRHGTEARRAAVMFRDAHMRELRPASWQTQVRPNPNLPAS